MSTRRCGWPCSAGAGPSMLKELHAMDEGDVRLIRRGRKHVVVKLLEKTGPPKGAEPPDREVLRQRLTGQKRAEALDKWVDGVMEGAYVFVDEDAVKQAAKR